jgi:hypothetical protein
MPIRNQTIPAFFALLGCPLLLYLELDIDAIRGIVDYLLALGHFFHGLVV